MKRFFRCLACMMAAVVFVLSFAQAGPRYPVFQGNVTDAAAVFSTETVNNLRSVIDDVRDETGVNLTIVTVDFLDGYTIDAYAQGLREQWQLLSNNMLLVIAVGEDRCMFALAGEGSNVLITPSAAQKLASTYVEPAMLREDYNGAMHDFIPALLTEMNKAYDTRLSADYFGMPAVTAEPMLPSDWLADWTFQFTGADRQPEDYHHETEDDDEISQGKIILTLVLLSIVFGKRGRRRRHEGCGCSPISRILAMFGLWRLWDRD